MFSVERDSELIDESEITDERLEDDVADKEEVGEALTDADNVGVALVECDREVRGVTDTLKLLTEVIDVNDVIEKREESEETKVDVPPPDVADTEIFVEPLFVIVVHVDTLAEIVFIPLLLAVPPETLAVTKADDGVRADDNVNEGVTVTDTLVLSVYIADGEFEAINETDILLVAEIASVTLP